MEEKQSDRSEGRTAVDLGFDDTYPDKFLMDFVGQCLSGNNDDVRVLVPLCGKSFVDMKWLYDERMRVYGVDASEKTLQQFFKEYDMQYLHTPAISDGFSLFKNDDGKIRLFSGDFFHLSKSITGCLFNVIWDRGAFVTLSPEEREQYVDVVRQLLLPTGRILLATYTYDTSKWRGPPYIVKREHIHKYFGDDFHINSLKAYNCGQDWHLEKWGIDWMKEIGYMLSPKI